MKFNRSTALVAGIALGVVLVKKYTTVAIDSTGKITQIVWSW